MSDSNLVMYVAHFKWGSLKLSCIELTNDVGEIATRNWLRCTSRMGLAALLPDLDFCCFRELLWSRKRQRMSCTKHYATKTHIELDIYYRLAYLELMQVIRQPSRLVVQAPMSLEQ